jgi:hypothetical protein
VTEQTDEQYELEEAEYICELLTGEIEMLRCFAKTHEEGCASGYEAKLEAAILGAALTYYARKVEMLSALIAGDADAEKAEAPVLRLAPPSGAAN